MADCDSSGEEPKDQDENYTYASMEDSTTESECDDAEELSTADVRWENSKSYLNSVLHLWKRQTVYFAHCLTVNVTMYM